MKAIIIGLLIIGMLFGCGETPPPPPGYKVLCSVDGEKYCLWIPNERLSEGGDIGANIFNSKKDAISYAYSWEEYRYKVTHWPSEKYEWSECKEGK